jgi:hypothetical protein
VALIDGKEVSGLDIRIHCNYSGFKLVYNKNYSMEETWNRNHDVPATYHMFRQQLERAKKDHFNRIDERIYFEY